jgi:hypothetical protein
MQSFRRADMGWWPRPARSGRTCSDRDKGRVLSAKIYVGDTSGNLTNEADFFEILAPNSRQVRAGRSDDHRSGGGKQPVLKTLNMKAAY